MFLPPKCYLPFNTEVTDVSLWRPNSYCLYLSDAAGDKRHKTCLCFGAHGIRCLLISEQTCPARLSDTESTPTYSLFQNHHLRGKLRALNQSSGNKATQTPTYLTVYLLIPETEHKTNYVPACLSYTLSALNYVIAKHIFCSCNLALCLNINTPYDIAYPLQILASDMLITQTLVLCWYVVGTVHQTLAVPSW